MNQVAGKSVYNAEQARFVTRTECIACGSTDLRLLSRGRFHDEPVHGFMSADPFGESPLPHLVEAEWCFVECSKCSQKFHQNILDPHWIEVYYNRWITSEAIAEYLRLNSGSQFKNEFGRGVHAVERILQLEQLTRDLRGSEPVKVLDFGCGEGHFLATCASFGFECTGIEFSSAREATKRIEFYNSLDQLAHDAPGKTFHAVVLFEVLEHLAEPLGILQKLRPLMATGGILILETPNCETVQSISNRTDYHLIDPLGHINAFTPNTLKAIAMRAGFAPVKSSIAQCSADPLRIYKREAKRLLRPAVKATTQQFFKAV
jgi:2-polyprenyl-3-methyl-5-hydroxy-6-metoxy-1,4-benzoquinol methylase